MKKLILILITFMVLAFTFTGCEQSQNSDSPGGQTLSMGTIEVQVTDAPPDDDVTSIVVTVSGVKIHRAVAEQVQEQEQGEDQDKNQEQEQEQQEGEGEWITLNIKEGAGSFDLLQIKGLEEVLAVGEVAAGRYTQVRMEIEKVEVTLGDGEPQEATLPSGVLKFIHPFDIEDGETTVLLLDFDADRSVNVTGSDKIIVSPVVKVSVTKGQTESLTSIEGTIEAVDTVESTVSIITGGSIEPVVLQVIPQTEISLDGEQAVLEDLVDLGEGHSVIGFYNSDNMKAVTIEATSP